MADVKRKYNLSAKGVLSISEDGIFLSVEDVGDIDLATLLEDFDDKEIKLNVTYDEDYGASDVEVDTETGEVI